MHTDFGILGNSVHGFGEILEVKYSIGKNESKREWLSFDIPSPYTPSPYTPSPYTPSPYTPTTEPVL